MHAHTLLLLKMKFVEVGWSQIDFFDCIKKPVHGAWKKIRGQFGLFVLVEACGGLVWPLGLYVVVDHFFSPAALNRFFHPNIFPGQLEKQPPDISPGVPGRAEVGGDGWTPVCLSRFTASVSYQQPCQVTCKTVTRLTSFIWLTIVINSLNTSGWHHHCVSCFTKEILYTSKSFLSCKLNYVCPYREVWCLNLEVKLFMG